MERPLDDILRRFANNVRASGGSVLDDLCRATVLPPLPKVGVPEQYTCSCGGRTRVAVPYERQDKRGNVSAGFATFCANCDVAYKMPRFAVT